MSNIIVATSPSHSRAATSSVQLPTTPKSRQPQQQQPRRQQQQQQRKTQSVSPASAFAYAGSSICSSPSARNVPLPPIEWLNQLQVPGSCESSLPSRPSSSNSCSSSVSSSQPSSPCPSVGSSTTSADLPALRLKKHEMPGVRVCPMQLIAAVASA